MNPEEKVLAILSDGLPRTVQEIAKELMLRDIEDEEDKYSAMAIAKTAARSLVEQGKAKFNNNWLLEVVLAPVIEETNVEPVTLDECNIQANRLLILAIQQSSRYGGDFLLQQYLIKLKLAYQDLADYLKGDRQ